MLGDFIRACDVLFKDFYRRSFNSLLTLVWKSEMRVDDQSVR